MKTTYRKLYKFETYALAEAWLIKTNPSEKLDIYLEEFNSFFYYDVNTQTIIEQGAGSSDSQPSTIRMAKHSSVTSEHIGLLAMQEVTLLNQNPQGIDDFQIQVKVADTTPPIESEKAIYKISVSGIQLTMPETKVIRVTFNANPSEDDRIKFLDSDNSSPIMNGGYEFVTFKTVSPNIASNECLIGTDVTDTIANIVALFDLNATALSTNFARITSTGSNYVDFEMRWLDFEGDVYKYMRESFIASIAGDFTISTQRALDVQSATRAQNLSQLGNSGTTLLSAQSWDYNGSTLNLITYGGLFRNDYGQPNGLFGAFGLRYFQNHTDCINALTWALSYENNIQNIFDITQAFQEDIVDGTYNMTIRTKTAPTSNSNSTIYFNGNNYEGVSYTTELIQEAVVALPERITNSVVGVIVGVDGNDVIISTAGIVELTMCSAQDGAMGTVPLSIDLFLGNYFPYLVAWRGGKVIDYAGYYQIMQDTGFTNDSTLFYPLIVGGMFRPLTGAIPDGKVIADSKFIYFGG